MAIDFSDNFDGEDEGTSPPVNWVNQSMTTCEVDDAQASTSPHSMKCAVTSADGYVRHAINFTDAAFITEYYMANLGNSIYIRVQSTNGNASGAYTMVMIRLTNGGAIYYYDGASWIYTGYNWGINAFHVIKIVMNTTAFTFDAWYDDTQIVNDGDFYQDQTPALSVHYGVRNLGDKTCWFDDIQIGEADVIYTRMDGETYVDPTDIQFRTDGEVYT